MASLSKTKVLLLITKSNFGGAQRYVFDLAVNLPKDTYDVAVACGGNGELVKRLEAYGTRVVSIPDLKRDISILKEVRALVSLFTIVNRERPDILHVNSSKAAGLGALVGRLLGVKRIIFTGHGWAFNEARPYWQKALIALSLFVTIMLVHKTIAVSEKTKQDIVKHLPSLANKITVIYNGTSDIHFESKEVSRRILSTFEPNFAMNDASVLNGYWVGFNGEIHKNKGIDIGVKAMKAVLESKPDAYFVIVGVGDWRERVRNLVSEFKLEKRIFFLGAVPDARNYMTAYDLFLLPSRTEALPYVLIEAGFAKLPVVATAVGGIPEIISDGENGLLVEPRNAEALSGAILKLMNNAEAAHQYGAALNKSVTQKFNLENMLKETKDAYAR